MIDAEILRMKLNLTECSLDKKQKEEFLTKLDDFHDVFSLRDEIGTCPFIEVYLCIIQKGLTGYSSLVVLVKRKNRNLYRVCSDF